jgi:archaellum biogenesis ATPase FlaH
MNILNTLNNIMRILNTDLYIDCDDLIKEANILYEIAKEKEIHKADLNYIESMNKYINTYDKFKEKQIKQYITDLKEYINII